MKKIVKSDVSHHRRTIAPHILFAVVVSQLLVALPVPMPSEALGGDAPASQTVQPGEDRAVGISPADAAARIAEERAQTQSQQRKSLEVDTRRTPEQAAKEAADAAASDAKKRKQAEELARRKAESDKTIAQELENLKRAREEADRAKAAKRKAETNDAMRGQMSAKRASPTRAASGTALQGRCVSGHVVYRKGRRWYVTGADDTLWQIAKRYYGSGSAYPRIYRANRKRLASPHVVRPCLSLRLPGR